jgi:signal transduction histidine kinase
MNADTRPRVQVSRPQLQMAFSIIIKNGIEAHAMSNSEFAAGSVTVTIAVVDQIVRVQIIDHGKGMSARDLEKLIEFVPGNTSKKHLGTGYGLPIAKRYIQAHGGKLTITSEEDKGTTVLVILPLEIKPAPTP